MSAGSVPQICITMAGFGRRFLDAGYSVPKYRVVVNGRSLFAWSLMSLAQFVAEGATCCFIVRRADQSDEFIRQEADAIGVGVTNVVELDAPTDGQATTALAAAPFVSGDRPFLIYNIDTCVEPRALPATGPRGDGWLPCFDGKGDGWSFAKADADGRVTEVREKQRISNHATLGLYWFRTFSIYEDVYRRHYGTGGNLEAGERYVAPLYNRLIEDGGRVYLHDVPVPAVYPLGTPAEVDAFRLRESPRLDFQAKAGDR